MAVSENEGNCDSPSWRFRKLRWFSLLELSGFDAYLLVLINFRIDLLLQIFLWLLTLISVL